MQTEQSYRLLLDNLSTAVLLLDDELRITYLNPAAEHLFSISASRMDGQPLASFFAKPERTQKALKRMQRSDQPFTQRQAKLLLPLSKEITVDYTATPLQETQKLLIELLPMDRLMQINREESLLAAHNTSRNLIRGLAHEIKNPLGGIRGAAQLLALELGEKSDIGEYTDIISLEVDRLCNLVDRLLGPSKLPHFRPCNIHEITEHVAALVEAEVGDSIKLIRDYDPSIPDLLCDKEQLIQAFLNIVRNATQALKESGQPSPTIRLRSRIQRNFTIGKVTHKVVCKLDIADNGPGIPEDIVDRIFFPMISGRAEGTGLGLPISQSAINLHHGLIKCHKKNDLTYFTIYLPLERISNGH